MWTQDRVVRTQYPGLYEYQGLGLCQEDPDPSTGLMRSQDLMRTLNPGELRFSRRTRILWDPSISMKSQHPLSYKNSTTMVLLHSFSFCMSTQLVNQSVSYFQGTFNSSNIKQFLKNFLSDDELLLLTIKNLMWLPTEKTYFW